MKKANPRTLGEAHENLVKLSHALAKLHEVLTLLSLQLRDPRGNRDAGSPEQAQSQVNQIRREMLNKSARVSTRIRFHTNHESSSSRPHSA